MPWPAMTVPKFGEWDSNDDLAYSVVFDKARADKEKALAPYIDEALYQSRMKASGKGPGMANVKGPSHAEEKTTMEQETKGSATSSANLSMAPRNPPLHEQQTSSNSKVDTWNFSERGSTHAWERGSTHGSSKSSSGQHVAMAYNEEASLKRPVSYSNGSHAQTAHDTYAGRQHRPPAFRQMHQGYSSGEKTPRSIGGMSDCSSTAGIPEKVTVPRFGEWDDAQMGEGYSIIFDRARDEKKSTATKKTTPRVMYPRAADEDLYNTKSMRRKRQGWLNCICCFDVR